MSEKQSFVPYVHSDGQVWDYYFVDPKSDVIYFIKSHNGKKIKFSTRETNGNRAKRAANAEFDKRTGKTQRHVRTLIKDELKSWELLKESEELKYDTLNNVKRARRQIKDFWGDKLPSEINRDSFAEWCAWWKVENPKIQMENAIKYFNNFCAYLHQKIVNDRPLLPSNLRFQDPNRKAIHAKRARKKERVLTFEEFKIVHETAESEVEALVVLFMYTMGTRIDETLKLDFSRVILDDEVPIYRWSADNNKAQKIGQHALHKSLIEPLMALRDRRASESTNLLFPQKQDNQKALREQMIDWDEWRKRAKIDFHWTPHTLRHTCLTNLFNDAKNPQAVICLLYRTSLQVALGTYIKVTQEAMLLMRDSIKVNL